MSAAFLRATAEVLCFGVNSKTLLLLSFEILSVLHAFLSKEVAFSCACGADFGSDFTDSLSELHICGEDVPAYEFDLFTGVSLTVVAELKMDDLIGGSVTDEVEVSPTGSTFINSLRGRGSDLESDE